MNRAFSPASNAAACCFSHSVRSASSLACWRLASSPSSLVAYLTPRTSFNSSVMLISGPFSWAPSFGTGDAIHVCLSEWFRGASNAQHISSVSRDGLAPAVVPRPVEGPSGASQSASCMHVVAGAHEDRGSREVLPIPPTTFRISNRHALSLFRAPSWDTAIPGLGTVVPSQFSCFMESMTTLPPGQNVERFGEGGGAGMAHPYLHLFPLLPVVHLFLGFWDYS